MLFWRNRGRLLVARKAVFSDIQVSKPGSLRSIATAYEETLKTGGRRKAEGVCTENLIRVDAVMESRKLME